MPMMCQKQGVKELQIIVQRAEDSISAKPIYVINKIKEKKKNEYEF